MASGEGLSKGAYGKYPNEGSGEGLCNSTCAKYILNPSKNCHCSVLLTASRFWGDSCPAGDLHKISCHPFFGVSKVVITYTEVDDGYEVSYTPMATL